MAKAKPNASAVFDKLMKVHDRLPVPQLADISAAFIAEMGGPGPLAKMMVTEYLAAKPGSMTRAKILDPVLRGLRRDAELPPVELLDDERLKKLLGTTLKELAEIENEVPGPTTEHAEQPGAEAAPAAEGTGATADRPAEDRAQEEKEATGGGGS